MKTSLLLYVLLLPLAILSVAGQETGTLKGKAYKLGDKNAMKLKGPDDDCNIQRILFVTDTSFLSITKCNDVETVGKGCYRISKKAITLEFGNTVLKRVHDNSDGRTYYSTTTVVPRKLTLGSSIKKKQLRFDDHSNTMLPTEGYTGALLNVTEDNSAMRLGIAAESNIDIFDGTDFSPKYDSLIVKRGLEKLNAEVKLDYFDEDNTYSGTEDNYYEGKVHYSPDGKVKIIVFAGEGCGAYCNSMYAAVARFPSGAVSEYIDINNIITFEKYERDNYLVIDTAWGGGMMGGNELSVKVVSIEGDAITFLPLNLDTAAADFSGDQYSFTISSPWWGFDFEKLEYEPLLQKITYCYLDKGIDPEMLPKAVPESKRHLQSGKALMISGSFTFKDRKATNATEEYTVVKVPAE